MERHPEGGYFAEYYTSGAELGEVNGRRLMGSIYFLLREKDISHFHEIDCDELWYYHGGCGLKIRLIDESGKLTVLRLGMDIKNGEVPMIEIKKGTLFAAENLDKGSYTLVSCATAPKFNYKGFRLVSQDEMQKRFPSLSLPKELFTE